MSDSLHVRFWGVRGSIPTPYTSHLGVGGNTPCVEVWSDDGSHCIFDLGTGSIALGRQLVEQGHQDVHVFLSHFHRDHIHGFPFFMPLFSPGTNVTVYAHNVDGDPQMLLKQQMDEPFFPIGFDDLPADISVQTIYAQAPVQIGAITVEPFPVHHTQFVHGFRIRTGDTTAVYCTDYEHGNAERDAQLFDMTAGANLLICDAQYTPAEHVSRVGWGHSTWAHAAELARQAEVDKLALFHHDPDHDDDFLADVLQQAQGVFSETSLATEGDVIHLG